MTTTLDTAKRNYSVTLGWTAIAFAVALTGAALIGPAITPAMRMPISLGVIAILAITSFVRTLMTDTVAKILVFVIPAALGAITYPWVAHLASTGDSGIVLMALAGTAIVFGAAAVLGWTSRVSLESWSNKLVAVIFGMIAVGLLNAFVFHLPVISLVISIISLIVFSVLSFVDLQRVRDGRYSSPARAALSIFLDVFNIFTSLLNILGYSR